VPDEGALAEVQELPFHSATITLAAGGEVE
jgi:hypothetical protein